MSEGYEMYKNVLGYDVNNFLKLDLNLSDLYILRWYCDYCNTTIFPRMIKDNKEYLRFDYIKVIKHLRCLKIKDIKACQKSIFKLCGLHQNRKRVIIAKKDKNKYPLLALNPLDSEDFVWVTINREGMCFLMGYTVDEMTEYLYGR